MRRPLCRAAFGDLAPISSASEGGEAQLRNPFETRNAPKESHMRSHGHAHGESTMGAHGDREIIFQAPQTFLCVCVCVAVLLVKKNRGGNAHKLNKREVQHETRDTREAVVMSV